ncbi:hypothetical protein [Phaeodactylibacter xiamenensis]|uniref:hypothetical protein n=1 Tax=Phaeodactylibacter xiamenensis TaxID=1524460 RepID=UPI003CCBE6D7
MNPISAIALAASNITSTVIDAFTFKDRAMYNNMPGYSDPKDYLSPRFGIELFIGGMFLLFIIIGVVVALRR